MKRIIFFILLFTLLFSCTLDESLDQLLREAIDYKGFVKDKWTIMVYLCADNDLNPNSVYDINEMIVSGGSDENVNILVLWDQTLSYTGGDRHGYYLVKYSGPQLLLDTGEVNMGNPQTAINFIDFAAANYKADHYIFVFWDHGDGVDKSYISSVDDIQKQVAIDFTNGFDSLTDNEQVEILQYLKNKLGKKLEILAYDACLMGMVEIMHQARNYANYFIGSEDNVPGYGLDYTFIHEIIDDPSISANTVAKKIISHYASFYSSANQVTMSAINLTKMTELSSYITSFVSFTVAEDSNKDCFYYTTPIHIGDEGELEFYPSSSPNKTGYGFTDLYYYMNKVKQKLLDASNPGHPAIIHADNIINFIDNGGIIVSEYHGLSHNGKSEGISILLSNIESEYSSNAFNTTTNWASFINWLDIP